MESRRSNRCRLCSGGEASILFGRSNGRWSTALGHVQVGLRLISATPGLFLGSESLADVFARKSTSPLRSGDALDFTPVVRTFAAAALGSCSATFQLDNLGGSGFLAHSRVFSFDLRVLQAPGPGAYVLMLAGMLGLAVIRQPQRA